MNITIKVNRKDLTKLSPSPAFAYCRKLIAEGVDPSTRLEIYGERDTFDYAITSIGMGAELSMQEDPYLAVVKYELPTGLKGSRKRVHPPLGCV